MAKWIGNQGYMKPESEADVFVLRDGTGSTEVVIKLHHYVGCGDAWFVSCHQLGIDRFELGNIPVEQAKDKAYAVVFNKIQKMYLNVLAMKPVKTFSDLHRLAMNGWYNIKGADGELLESSEVERVLSELKADILARLNNIFGADSEIPGKIIDAIDLNVSIEDGAVRAVEFARDKAKVCLYELKKYIESSEF